MPDSLLTPRDTKALLALLNARIEGERSAASRAPWEAVRQRLRGDLAARPKSMASAIATLVNSARSGQLPEVDRMAKLLVGSLVEHGDLEGSNLLRKVADATYEKPRQPPPRPAQPSTPRGAPPGGGAMQLPQAGENSAIEWFEPRDLRGEYVLDSQTGPVLERLVAELRLADDFIDAGVDAPTRALFSGPPGTGKTMGAKWIGGCLEMPVAVVRLDSVMGSHLGETSKRMRAVLQEAASRGGVLFLDEIDGMLQSRETSGSDGCSEELKRVTSALLQQLDMLPQQHIVIAATNFPDRIDPALRSRLATEVVFRNPDPAARLAMVLKHWAKIDASEDARSAFVEGTEGKSGRFIRASAMAAARTAMLEAASIGDAIASLDQDCDGPATKARITVEHVVAALADRRGT